MPTPKSKPSRKKYPANRNAISPNQNSARDTARSSVGRSVGEREGRRGVLVARLLADGGLVGRGGPALA